MRWGFDHTQFPADPALTEMKRRLGETPRLWEHLGPHQNRELGMMLAGKKPLALIEPDRLHFWLPHCMNCGWVIDRDAPGDMTWIAPSDQAWRINAAKRVYRWKEYRGYMTVMDHARLGVLLGYRKDTIRYFIDTHLEAIKERAMAARETA